jgi:hypothetical protein
MNYAGVMVIVIVAIPRLIVVQMDGHVMSATGGYVLDAAGLVTTRVPNADQEKRMNNSNKRKKINKYHK